MEDTTLQSSKKALSRKVISLFFSFDYTALILYVGGCCITFCISLSRRTADLALSKWQCLKLWFCITKEIIGRLERSCQPPVKRCQIRKSNIPSKDHSNDNKNSVNSKMKPASKNAIFDNKWLRIEGALSKFLNDAVSIIDDNLTFDNQGWGKIHHSCHILVQCKNLCPEGKVRVQWLCHLNGFMLLQGRVVPTTFNQGVTNQPISQVITNNLALPISYCVVSEISFSDIWRGNRNRSRELCPELFWEAVFWNNRIECSYGSCALACNGSSQKINIRLCRDDQILGFINTGPCGVGFL